MDREFTYTKKRLAFLVRDMLERDILAAPQYGSIERAEEGFEKRAALEFLTWFLDEAFPENFSFRCRYEQLEEDYPEPVARAVSEGRGWVARRVRDEEVADNVVFVDFRDRD